jgi:hypothetical protein
MAKFVGLKNDTLEAAGPKGESIFVGLGTEFTADPSHPQVERALRIGSIQAVPELEIKGGK